MKYPTASILLFLVFFIPGQAQQKIEREGFDNPINTFHVETLSSKHKILLKADAFTKSIAPWNYVGNQPLTNLVYLEGTRQIQLTAYLPHDSISFYRYSITANDRDDLITDAIPTQIDFVFPPGSGLPGTAIVNLGSYHIENKKLRLELYKTTERHQVSTVIFYNKPIRPAELFLIYQQKKLKNGRHAVDMNNLPQGATIKMADDLKGLLFSIKHTDIAFLYHVYLKHVVSGRITPLSNNWLYNYIAGNPYLAIDAGHFREQGDYELVVTPVLSGGANAKPLTQKSTVFRFRVEKELIFTKKEISILVGAILALSGIVIGTLKVRSNKRLAREQQEKKVSQLQLQVVRAQLNPHFMFNALASIQNLMNKQDSDNANRYLGKFARLTCNVLKNQEFISLEDEIALLDDYLQMEKLRFGFHYTISVEEALEAANVEIPAMLLQPFVENAVKHGVSALQAKGEITIRFAQKDRDLLLVVSDNGTGFDPEARYAGLGLDLSRRRIALLNQVYKHTPILLRIDAQASGTEVKISLIQWL